MAISYGTKYVNRNYPLAGELRIPCTYILTDTLLVHGLQRQLCKQMWAETLRWSEDQTAGQYVS